MTPEEMAAKLDTNCYNWFDPYGNAHAIHHRRLRDDIAAAVRAYHEQELLRGVGDPPVSAEREAEIRAGPWPGRWEGRPSDEDLMGYDLLRLLDFWKAAAAWHAREAGHLEEYERGYADGLRDARATRP